MNKKQFSEFIQKYYLGGIVESCNIHIFKDKLYTIFVTKELDLTGEISCVFESELADAKLSINNTNKLLKLLSILNDDIKLDIKKIHNKLLSIVLSDKKTKVEYSLCDISVIPKEPSKVSDIVCDTEFCLYDDFISTFIKAKSALSDEYDNRFNIINDNGIIKIIIGYSKNNSNRVEFEMQPTMTGLNFNYIFNSDHLKAILTTNKTIENCVFKLNSDGILLIEFYNEVFNIKYSLFPMIDI